MSKYQKYYKRGQIKATNEAIEYQFKYSEGYCPSYEELAEWCEYFRKLGKRFGLLREFTENGII